MRNSFKDISVAIIKNLIAFLFTAIILVGILFLLAPQFATPQKITTLLPTPLPAVSTPITYGDALDTYQSIATSAIQASERAIDFIKWIVGIIFALSTGAAGLGSYIYRTARDSAEKAQIASKAAEDARIPQSKPSNN